MQGLTEEQIAELKLKDEWQSKCIPSGGYKECKDPVGRRSGLAPDDKMADVLNRTRQEAKTQVSKVSFCFNFCFINISFRVRETKSCLLYLWNMYENYHLVNQFFSICRFKL